MIQGTAPAGCRSFEHHRQLQQEAKGLKADRDFTTLNCISLKQINTNVICVHLALTNAIPIF